MRRPRPCFRLACGTALLATALPTTRHSAAAAQTPTGNTPRAVAFVDVTVIDVNDGRRIPEQTVVVAGNRIQAVGPSREVRAPSGAQVVEAKGKYLIPGLWDMHAHTEYPGAEADVQDSLYRKFYPVYIASGVTGLREMAQRFPNGPDSFRVWQRDVMAGARVGPRAVGPSADLAEFDIATPEDARALVDSLKAAGLVFLKLHDEQMSADIYFAILREARRIGIPVVGHLTVNVTAIEASDSGQQSVEHFPQNRPCWLDWKGEVDADSTAAEQLCAPMARAYVRNTTWMVPTLVLFFYHLQGRYVPDAQRFLGMLHRQGVRTFLAGTDCATEFLQNFARQWPDKWAPADSTCHRGVSVLQEIILFAGSGLTPLEALQTATLNPAKFLGATDSLGTVAPGKLADLVLLDGDPLADTRNVVRIRAVVANGRYFDRATLDTFDPEATQLAKRFAEQVSGRAPAAGKAGP